MKNFIVFAILLVLNYPLYKFLYKLYFKPQEKYDEVKCENKDLPLGFSREHAKPIGTEFKSGVFLLTCALITLLEYRLVLMFL